MFPRPLLPRTAAAAAARAGAAAATAPRAGAAQPARAVAGEVVQAETGAPIEGATVVLAPATAGALGGDAARSAFVGAARNAVTGASGRYAFADVPPGRYVLRVHRLGFRPATLEVELRGDAAAGPRVSVGLTVVPVRLRPVEVGAAAPEPFARHARSVQAAGDARAAALRLRQRRYLSGDVREVTQADVADGVSFGETDLFRALQRMPGVATRNDLTAELWTRASRWDQTRVTWDGLPLYNPVHVAGLLSAVNSDAVGAAFLHPGVRPAALGEGSAAVLDLRSRAGGGGGALRGVGELSLLSGRATLDQAVAGGRGAWMLSARRSYADWLFPAVARAAGGVPEEESRFPLHFAEVAGRGDWRFGAHALEVSALRSQDYFTGDVADVVHGSRARWGNTIARATLAGPARLGSLGAVVVRHTLGASAYDGRVRRAPVDSAILARGLAADSMAPVRAAVRYWSLAGEVAPEAAGPDGPRWGLGYELSRQRAASDGQLRALYAYEPRNPALGRVAGGVTQLAVWGERRLRPTPRLTVAAGARAEGGGAVPGGGPLPALRLAPRLTGRYALGDGGTLVSAGLGRSYQYVQALALDPMAESTPLNFTGPVPLWLAPGARADSGGAAPGGGPPGAAAPAVRTDLATLGAERWLGAGWHAAVNAYARRTAGLAVGDPRPGAIADRPLFVVGGERAQGVEAGVRKLTGRWTATANAALVRARTRAAGLEFPSAQDQRYVVNGVSTWRLGRGLRVGAAYTAFAGAPFTRGTAGVESVFVRVVGGLPVVDTVFTPGERGAPNAGRLPRFARLDALAEWTGRVRRVRVGAYLQVHNVLLRGNPLGLSGYECGGAPGSAPACRDRFALSFPVAPVAGLRASF